MGHGHSHGGPPPNVEIGQLARNSLVGFLAALGILALLGVIWHWPTSSEVSEVIKLPGQVEGVTYADAKITGFNDCPDADPNQLKCTMVDATITNGENKGTEVSVEITGPVVEAGLTQGDSIEVAQFPNDGGYAFSNVNRRTVLVVMGVLFLVAVVAVARLRGLLALVGLGLAGVVLIRFMLPAILIGKPGMVVALAGSTAIMFVVLYVAHGISWRTTAALAGTMLGLALTTGLGVLSAQAARLTGFADDNEIGLAQLAPNLNFRDLFMVGIIVGGLGVLNDVTITQASAVWELRAAAPEWSRRRVFASGMRIGRDHIASTIYTIVFAYAGSALTVLLMLYFTNRDALAMLNVELFAGEAVRTLGSAIGLILSVPITTGIAALIVGQARPKEEEPAEDDGDPADDGDTHSPDDGHSHADEHVAEDPYAEHTPENPYARPGEHVEPAKPRRGV